MKRKGVTDLERQVEELLEENAYLRSLCDSFDTGNVPHNATFRHLVYAQWGRKRLEERRKHPALLAKEVTNVDKTQ